MNSPEAWTELLDSARVRLDPGLTDDELADVESCYGFVFAPVHRLFLTTGVPVGDGWVDCRNAPEAELHRRLNWPAEGLVFDVLNNAFWPRSWGARPQDRSAATDLALNHIDRLPQLIPIYGHRYLPAAPTVEPTPVFSVYQSDVIYYGYDLADYLANEFRQPRQAKSNVPSVGFWSDLAYGADAEDL